MQKDSIIGSVYSSSNRKESMLLLHGCFITPDTLLEVWQLLVMIDKLNSRITDNNKSLCGINMVYDGPDAIKDNTHMCVAHFPGKELNNEHVAPFELQNLEIIW